MAQAFKRFLEGLVYKTDVGMETYNSPSLAAILLLSA